MCRCWLNVGVLLAFVLAALTHVSPASATAVILTPPADLRLQTPGLAPWGSPGDAAAPKRVMHPLLAEILAGVGGALVSVPLTLLVGTRLCCDSPNLLVAALPPLILLLAVPTLVVTFAEWGVARAMGLRAQLQPTIYIALGAQLLVFVGAFFIGVSTGNIESAALFTLVELIVLPGVVTISMNLDLLLRHEWVADERPPVPLPATMPVADRPAGSDTHGLSLFAKAF